MGAYNRGAYIRDFTVCDRVHFPRVKLMADGYETVR